MELSYVQSTPKPVSCGLLILEMADEFFFQDEWQDFASANFAG